MFGPLLEYTDLYVIWIYVPCFPPHGMVGDEIRQEKILVLAR